MNMLLAMLSDNPTEKLEATGNQVWETVQPVLKWVLWVLTAVVAVVFIVKGVTTALAVMKAADEPQVRQEKIQGFKYLAIGLGIALVIALFSASILTWVVGE